MNEKELLAQLAQPFEPKHITWKPGATSGEKCLALAYADLRAYQERLDTICGLDWSIEYLPWGDSRVIARLTIGGVTRSSTGEMSNQDIKNEMGGTVAEAQAMKRAAAQFGLGRYLYDLPSVWVAYDASKKRITEQGRKELDSRYAAWYSRQIAQQAPQAARRNATPDSATVDSTTTQRQPVPASEDVDFTRQPDSVDYLAIYDKLTGNCAKLAEWCKNAHANSNGPASGAQYQYLAGVINAITGSDASHRQVLGVLVGRDVDSSNPPGRDLCSRLLDWLPAEKTDSESGEKVANPTHKAEYVSCIKNIWQVASGQLDLFGEAA